MTTISVGSLFAVLACGIGLVGILLSIFWLWMIIDCATHEPSEGNNKLVWLLIIIFTHGIGSLLYFFIRRPERIRLTGH